MILPLDLQALITHADALNEAIVAILRKHAPPEKISSDEVYDYVMCSGVEELAQIGGDAFRQLSRADQHAVAQHLLDRLKPDDGIRVRMVHDMPVWLRVAPVEDGHLPSEAPYGWRWIRLDTITQVMAKVGIGVASDPEEWQYTLVVVAGDTLYHATAVRFRGASVNTPLDRLLNTIGSLLCARIQRD